MSGTGGEATLIAKLNDLVQLTRDAVEAYAIGIGRARDPRRRDSPVAFPADHKRHVEELAALVRANGGLPTVMPHPTGARERTHHGRPLLRRQRSPSGCSRSPVPPGWRCARG